MAISVLQEVHNEVPSGGGTTFTIAVTLTVTPGSALHVYVMENATASGGAITLSDTNGQTYTLSSSVNDSSRIARDFYLIGATGGSTTITATMTLGAFVAGIWVKEIGQCSAYQAGSGLLILSPGAGTDAVTSNTATPTSQPALVSGFTFGDNNADTTVAGTGFTTGLNTWPLFGAGLVGLSEHLRITSTSAIAATWTATAGGTSNRWKSVVAIFTEGAGGGGTTVAPENHAWTPPRRRSVAAMSAMSAPVVVPGARAWSPDAVGVSPVTRLRLVPANGEPLRSPVNPVLTQFAPDAGVATRPSRRTSWVNGEPMVPIVASGISALAPDAGTATRPARRPLPAPTTTDPLPVIRCLPFIAGQKLWLRGDMGTTISGGNVTSVLDQSGNGNDVVVSGTVPFNPSAINGQPGWTFGAAGYLVNTVSSILPAGSPRTIFVVCNPTTGIGGPVMSIRLTAVGDTYFFSPNYAGFAGGIFTDSNSGTNNATAAAPTSAPHIAEYICAATPAFLGLKVDGLAQSVTQVGPCPTETGTTGFQIGKWNIAGPNYVGDICEVIVYDSVLSSTDEAAVLVCLATRYGIAVSLPIVPDQQFVPQRRLSRPMPSGGEAPVALSAPALGPFVQDTGPRAAPRRQLSPTAWTLDALPPLTPGWVPDLFAPPPPRRRSEAPPQMPPPVAAPASLASWIPPNDVATSRRIPPLGAIHGHVIPAKIVPPGPWGYEPPWAPTRTFRGQGARSGEPLRAVDNTVTRAIRPPLWAVVVGEVLSITDLDTGGRIVDTSDRTGLVGDT
jgi:hypothetical protein